ncbi:MAG TPA: OmpA family protein [Patescibacteria group bacterium]|nr:OmpA family protein [Patescibacteria group bacterium]
MKRIGYSRPCLCLLQKVKCIARLAIFLSAIYIPLIAQTDTITYKVRLPESINGYSNITTPVISEDGNTLWFDRKYHPDNNDGVRDADDPWTSRFMNGTWQPPENVSNSRGADIIFPSSVGAGFYYNPYWTAYFFKNEPSSHFYDNIPIPGQGRLKPVPVRIQHYYNTSQYISAFRSPDKRIILLGIEREDTRGNLDLYVSIDGNAPRNLGPAINTTGIETAPLLARDGKTLYFASNGHGGYGKLDLFKSTRLDDTWQTWSQPQNLGRVINTREDENSMCLTQTGDTAYVVSWDSLSERRGIYMVYLGPQYRPEKVETPVIVQTRVFDRFPDVRFLKNSAHISDEERLSLYEAFKLTDKNVKLIIRGYTDNSGTERHNLTLSRRRAENVVQELLIMGFKNRNIRLEARGASDFKTDNSTEELQALNRRVEIEIIP